MKLNIGTLASLPKNEERKIWCENGSKAMEEAVTEEIEEEEEEEGVVVVEAVAGILIPICIHSTSWRLSCALSTAGVNQRPPTRLVQSVGVERGRGR